MKTLLFDTDSGKVISPVFENGYLVDGQPQPVDPPIFELEYKPTPMPSHDSETETVSAVWVPDTVLKTYTQVWTVRALTDEERIARINAQADAVDQQLDTQATKKILQESLTGVPDAELPEYKTVYKAWRVPEPVYNQTDSPTGEADIRQWKDTLYRCIQSHTTQLDWEPDREPALWGKVGGEEIIEWYADIWMVIQVGELVQWQGKIYQCVNPTFAWIEPGTADGYHGWTEVKTKNKAIK